MINENKYGIHINVTDVEDSVLKEIEDFIQHVSTQEKELIEMEELQNNIKENILTKHIKENTHVLLLHGNR